MSEQKPTPTDILLYVVTIVFAAFIVIALIILLFLIKPNVERHVLERTALELADNIMGSKLTIAKSVFKKDELDNLKDIESIVRICEFGYKIKVKDLITGKEWESGYRRDKVDNLQDSMIREFPVAIATLNSNKINQAKLTIEMEDTYLTRITCLAERAYLTKEDQKMVIKDNIGSQSGVGFKITYSRKPSLIRKKSDNMYVCLLDSDNQETSDCRYFPYLVHKFSYREQQKNKGIILHAIPLKSKFSEDSTNICDQIDPSVIAEENDNIVEVALCIEEIEK